MIEFQAVYYDGRTSARRQVRVRGYTGILQIVAEALRLEVPLAEVRVDPPIAGTRRSLHLPGGAQLQTDDDAAVDAMFPHANAFERWVHSLERRWPHALAAVAAVAAFAWWGLVDGLPRAAKVAAGLVPVKMEATLGEQALSFFEGNVCHPSALGAARQRALQDRFAVLTAGLDDGHAYRLLPRDCRGVGANAFALPGGPVVITDALVKLAKSDDQISAVLAHEIGHVRGRHGLRLGLQAAGVAALATVIFGDATSITSLATTLPAALLQSGYSRALETEADDYAFERLREVGISPKAFAEIMALLEEDHKRRRAESGDYFSTHPATDKRIERALDADRVR